MPKILVVDDDPDFVLVSRAVLESAGFEVVEAADGDQALEMVRKAKPDLVLLDIMMSTTLEGIKVSAEIKSDPELEHIPVVMVSSIATTEFAAEFPDDVRLPIAAWISKPIQPDVLLSTVQRFVS